MSKPTPQHRVSRVLLVAFINSHVPELLRIARYLKKSKRHEPVILYVTKDEYLRTAFIEQAQRDGIPIIDMSGNRFIVPTDASQTTASSVLRATIRKRMQRWPWLNTSYGRFMVMVSNLCAYTYISRQMKNATHLYQHWNVQCIILPEESVFYYVAAFVNAGHRLGIPSVIAPYTIANATEIAEHAYEDRTLWVHGLLKQWVARRFPSWVFEHRGQKLFPFSVWRILATEMHNLTPPQPWMFNSGFADAIAVESPFMHSYYVRNGLPVQRLSVIGSISDDILYEAKTHASQTRKDLYAKYEFDSRKPLIVCAFPPPWFPRTGCEFANFEELKDHWMATLAAITNFNIIVTLHPRLSQEEFHHYAIHGRLVITEQPVIELIPLCELYIANVSATIRWAIATGKPVLNYDVYKYRFHDYDTAGGVVTVESLNDFQNVVTQCTTSTEYLNELTRRQQRISSEWAMLDGRSGKRFLDLLDRYMSKMIQSPNAHATNPKEHN